MGGEGFEPFWFLTEDFFFLYTKKDFLKKSFIMGGEGFEPSKASPADLQSVPFGHSGIHPFNEMRHFCTHSVIYYITFSVFMQALFSVLPHLQPM